MIAMTLAGSIGLLLLATPSGIADSAPAESWTQSSWQDFSRGTTGEAGNNLYVSRDGAVRSIRRFDLNASGYIDLVFNNTHDWYHDIPVSAASPRPDGSLQPEPLHVLGSQALRHADLNRNGYQDLVILPNRKNVQHGRHRLSLVYGGPDGWPDHRVQGNLPVHNSEDLAIADLNGDGWPDLAILNGRGWLPSHPPDEKIIRIYWGGPDGFHPSHLTDLPAGNAKAITAGDFSGNGSHELAVLIDPGQIRIYWACVESPAEFADFVIPEAVGKSLASSPGTGSAPDCLWIGTTGNQLFRASWRKPELAPSWREYAAFPATRLVIADIDGDGHLDALICQLSIHEPGFGETAGARGDERHPVTILWGSEDGFEDDKPLHFSVPAAIAAYPGDFSGNGLQDLGIAVHQGATTLTAQSLLFQQHSPRQFSRVPDSLETKGATDVLIARSGPELPPQILFANSRGGTLLGKVPVYVYWGGPDGFDPERRLEIPFRSAYSTTTADLNNNGYVDMVLLNSSYADQEMVDLDPTLGAVIYWGGPNAQGAGAHGFDPQHFTTLQEPNLGSCNVADLNGNGYLDLILGAYESAGNPDTSLVIYFGGPNGYSRERRVALPVNGRSIGCHLADFSDNGFLDIVLASYNTNRVQIFHGGPDGYSADRLTVIPMVSPIEVEVADLNDDGWLDLIVGSYMDPVAGHRDLGLNILWGGPDGFHPSRAQSLPGHTPNGLVVADFDHDGHLDILSLHYHGEISRESLPSYLYWGSADGFRASDRTPLFIHSGNDALAADFNGNGLIDIAVSAHSTDMDHRIESLVFYNDGNRFHSPQVQKLPTIGTHFMWNQDLGNVRDRSFRETFESEIFTWKKKVLRGAIKAEADLTEGTQLSFEVRSAGDADALATQNWTPVEEGEFPVAASDRVFQYRAHFHSPNGDHYPVLQSVAISLFH